MSQRQPETSCAVVAAQERQEPVAWQWRQRLTSAGYWGGWMPAISQENAERNVEAVRYGGTDAEWRALYLHPAPAAQQDELLRAALIRALDRMGGNINWTGEELADACLKEWRAALSAAKEKQP